MIYSCIMCGKEFEDTDELADHKARVHHDEEELQQSL